MTNPLGRRSLAVACAFLVSASIAGCAGGSDGAAGGGGAGGGGGGATVAFLMPDTGSTRYELHDRPGFENRLKELCPDCTPLYNNADGSADKQQQQFNSAVAQGAKVVVLDPVDSAAAVSLVNSAKGRGVKVIAYDRPIPDIKVDYYVSFDNQEIGRQIANSLIEKVKSQPLPPGAGILIVNGSPTDAAAGLIKKGVHEGVDPSGVPVLAEYDTIEWKPENAQKWVAGQISRFGDKIVGVVAANDGTGGGTIAAFKAAGIDPIPPVSGNDATVAGLQLVITGDQFNTISKPSEIVGGAAAEVADQLLKGQAPQPKTDIFGSPTTLFTPTLVTQQNIKAEVIDKDITPASELCTPDYAPACSQLGIAPVTVVAQARAGTVLLSLRGVTKTFGAVNALTEVDLDVRAGEVVALVGDNGAGKSTLVKVLAGVHQPDAGSISFGGREVSIADPSAAIELGVATVFQDLALCENLNVVDNLFLGRELSPWRLDETEMEVQSWQLLHQLSARIPTVRIPIASLSGGQRQTVAIARSLLGDPKVIILDEPTAALGVAQTAEVLDLIERLKQRGLGVIMISHNMEDVRAVADRIVVLRLGRNNGDFETRSVTTEKLVAAITGAADNVVTRRRDRINAEQGSGVPDEHETRT